MYAYFIRKIVTGLITLIGVSIIAFVLIRAVPGDTVTSQLGLNYTKKQADLLREDYGLNRALVVQYGLWVGHAIQGDLGQSYYYHQPVAAAIADRLSVTLELAGCAILLAVMIGVPLGAWAAIHRGRWLDWICSGVGVLGVSVPAFWLGTLLILCFAYLLGWLPSGSFVSLFTDPIANAKHMLLPICALSAAVAAVVLRTTRSAMLEVLSCDYVRTAVAKGSKRSNVIFRHALRNALVPVLTIVGIQAGYLLGGSVVIEMVFGLPGIGWAVYKAAAERDYFMLQGVVMFIAISFLGINILVDLAYAWADPRVRRR